MPHSRSRAFAVGSSVVAGLPGFGVTIYLAYQAMNNRPVSSTNAFLVFYYLLIFAFLIAVAAGWLNDHRILRALVEPRAELVVISSGPSWRADVTMIGGRRYTVGVRNLSGRRIERARVIVQIDPAMAQWSERALNPVG